MGPMEMTETLLEFPCAFPMKIVGRTEDGFAQAILEVVLRHAPNLRRLARGEETSLGRVYR